MKLLNKTLKFQENHLLSKVCTFGIGGPARYFVEVRTVDEMQDILMQCKEHSIPFFILGKGSNCLFDDNGFNGVVIANKIDFFEKAECGQFHAGAGYSFSLLGAQTARQGWGGLEFASGIPGTVGGAVFMNAGANGQETCNTLVSVDYVSQDGAFQTLAKEELHFAYRSSSFQKMSGAIVGATFQLSPSSEARHKQLKIITYRKKTQPYGDKSAGCIFQNPHCGHAGALIEQCGLKGTQIGGAKVSEVHGNFIVNAGGASSKDVLELITLIQQTIQEKKCINIESEVRYIRGPYE